MKSLKNKIILVTLVISPIIILSCKKNKVDEPEPISLRFSRNALEYVKLSEGKYRIYKDSATSLQDSVVVTESLLFDLFSPSERIGYSVFPPIYREQFVLTLTKFSATSQSEWFNGFASIDARALFPFPSIFHSSDTVDLSIWDQTNGMSFFYSENLHPVYSITINGKTYNNVIKTITENFSDINLPGYRKTTCYWAKGIGIIKREIITTGDIRKTSSLIRNN